MFTRPNEFFRDTTCGGVKLEDDIISADTMCADRPDAVPPYLGAQNRETHDYVQ